MCLFWRMMVGCYWRPGEVTEMNPKQVVPRTPDVNPDYVMKYSKTGELSESLLVSRQWLGHVIESWAAKQANQDRLWSLTLA